MLAHRRHLAQPKTTNINCINSDENTSNDDNENYWPSVPFSIKDDETTYAFHFARRNSLLSQYFNVNIHTFSIIEILYNLYKNN